MNSTNLEYFVTLAEELNFTQAARKLYISQQALSKMMSKLEEKLGIALFDRSTPLRLTTAGQVFYQSAKKILINMDECTRRLQEIKDFTRGNLRHSWHRPSSTDSSKVSSPLSQYSHFHL